MGRFNEELIKAGVMLAGEGLTGPDEGFVVDFNADPPVVTDGPYTEAKELFNGFWILDVSSKEEAKQWAAEVPLGTGVKLEVRRVSETEEFPLDNPWIQKEIQWRADLAEKARQAEAAGADRTELARIQGSRQARRIASRGDDLTSGQSRARRGCHQRQCRPDGASEQIADGRAASQDRARSRSRFENPA